MNQPLGKLSDPSGLTVGSFKSTSSLQAVCQLTLHAVSVLGAAVSWPTSQRALHVYRKTSVKPFGNTPGSRSTTREPAVVSMRSSAIVLPPLIGAPLASRTPSGIGAVAGTLAATNGESACARYASWCAASALAATDATASAFSPLSTTVPLCVASHGAIGDAAASRS